MIKVKALLLIKLCNKWLRLLDTKYKVRIPSRSFEISRLSHGTQGVKEIRTGGRRGKRADIGTGEKRMSADAMGHSLWPGSVPGVLQDP